MAVTNENFTKWLEDLCGAIEAGGRIQASDALRLLECRDEQVLSLLVQAERIRRRFFGNRVTLCAIVNARSGRCLEDCAFCSQSAHHQAEIKTYPMMEPEAILQSALKAAAAGATHFGIVTSGKGLGNGSDLDKAASAIRMIRNETGLMRCASLGVLNDEAFAALAEAELQWFHHNIETAPSFYDKVCTTRTFDDNVRAVELARSRGLSVCSGCLFGMGETPAQAVETAFFLRDLAPDSVPVNFLNPIPGTRLDGRALIDPLFGLRLIAMLRLVMPDRPILVCGGREAVLRDLQGLLFHAGATGLMIGDYLTTSGRPASQDLQLVRDLGLEPKAMI